MRRYAGMTLDELTPWANVSPAARDLVARVRELEGLLRRCKRRINPMYDKLLTEIDAALADGDTE